MPKISSPSSRGGILRLKLYLMVSSSSSPSLFLSLSITLSTIPGFERAVSRGTVQGQRGRGGVEGGGRSHNSKLLHRSPSRLSRSTDSRTNLGLKPVLRVAISTFVNVTILKILRLYNVLYLLSSY